MSDKWREHFAIKFVNAKVLIVLYIAFGVSWIIWSDLILGDLTTNQTVATNLSILNGCFFILITSILLFALLRLYRRYILMSHQRVDEAEANYRHLFQSSPVPMWIYDLHSFCFLIVNEAAISRYGYSREDFMGMTIFDIRPKNEHAALEQNLRSDDNKGYIFSGVWKHIKKNGDEIFVEIDSHPIVFQGRKAKLVMSLDVSELVQTQSEYRAVAEELNTFVYRASHDLRGPLARLIGIADLMKYTMSNEHAEYVNLLSKTAHLMDHMLQRLLTVNSLKEYIPNNQQIFLRDMVGQIAVMALEANSVDVPIKNNISADLIFKSDPKIIRLALESMIDNAIKYRDLDRPVYITIDATILEYQVIITVSDNGIGIDDDVRSRIFDLFFRGTERSNGSGLGLYIAREAVKRQGGRVRLVSGKRNNTVFEIVIPIAQ